MSKPGSKPETHPDSHMVFLKNNNIDEHRALISKLVQSTGYSDSMGMQYEYKNLRGYSAKIPKDVAELVSARSDVIGVYPDGIAEIQATTNARRERDEDILAIAQAAGGPQMAKSWGLQRIRQPQSLPPDSKPRALDYQYTEPAANATEVDCYIIDTGVRIDHQEFGHRATWGATFPPRSEQCDRDGHGTHVAATVAGAHWGVATTANIIAVKVLNEKGSGDWTDIVAGVEWCIGQHLDKPNVPCVINMSLGGDWNGGINFAVEQAVLSGIHVCVAAGNDGRDATNTSPASAAGVITVGATHIRDERSNFSNWGSGVHIFAPGSDITSAGVTSKRAFVALDGTSMASPHVAGVVAHRLRTQPARTPAQMLSDLQSDALPGVLENMNVANTPNLLVQI